MATIYSRYGTKFFAIIYPPNLQYSNQGIQLSKNPVRAYCRCSSKFCHLWITKIPFSHQFPDCNIPNPYADMATKIFSFFATQIHVWCGIGKRDILRSNICSNLQNLQSNIWSCIWSQVWSDISLESDLTIYVLDSTFDLILNVRKIKRHPFANF